jgi:hypothetical protein
LDSVPAQYSRAYLEALRARQSFFNSNSTVWNSMKMLNNLVDCLCLFTDSTRDGCGTPTPLKRGGVSLVVGSGSEILQNSWIQGTKRKSSLGKG